MTDQYALIDTNDQITLIQNNIDPTVVTKPGWRWLPVLELPAPDYDMESEKLIRHQALVDQEVHCWFEIAPKTPQEIQHQKTQKLEDIPDVLINLLLDLENKIRTLSSSSALDEYNYREYLKTLI